MTAGDGRGRRAVGRGLPAPLAERLAAGHWLRTAHRGAPTVAPGNSRAAIVAAAALGVDLVEVDVHATADGALALWHDDDLPAGDARLPLAATTLAELQRVDLGRGERLITLADAMAAVRGRAALLVDLKADGLAEPIVATARRLDFGPVVVCGGYWGSLCDVKRLAPEIGTSLTLERHWRAWHGDDAIERADTDALTVDARLLGEPGLLDRCHARGLAVLAWTVDRPEDMRRLLALGVDGLTSNRPDRFAALLGSRAAPAG